MITIAKAPSIDQTAYNHVCCPQCKSKIGWKPKGSRVQIFHRPEQNGGRMASLAVTCLRCKSIYFISADGD